MEAPLPTPINTAEAAKQLGVCERQVQYLAARGRIPGARKMGRDWFFHATPVVLPPLRRMGRPSTP